VDGVISYVLFWVCLDLGFTVNSPACGIGLNLSLLTVSKDYVSNFM